MRHSTCQAHPAQRARPPRARARALASKKRARLARRTHTAGCMASAQQDVHQSWLAEMGAFLRSVDPNHLIGAATEGFFVRNESSLLHLYNPGTHRAIATTFMLAA